MGPCGVSAACLFLSEQVCLAALDLSPFLQGVGTMVRSCISGVLCSVAKSNEGVMANPCLSAWPGFLGLAGPRPFGLLPTIVSWAAQSAN
jgi:hypothetical protein